MAFVVSPRLLQFQAFLLFSSPLLGSVPNPIRAREDPAWELGPITDRLQAAECHRLPNVKWKRRRVQHRLCNQTKSIYPKFRGYNSGHRAQGTYSSNTRLLAGSEQNQQAHPITGANNTVQWSEWISKELPNNPSKRSSQL
ncbi:hypothetical protein QBC45DRAFT_487946 [Copromyces sp. CBS 386.78]|nr:hypothetical protein QBC45DRAFT_487946 [Copromyces sp. CBS 386.78]